MSAARGGMDDEVESGTALDAALDRLDAAFDGLLGLVENGSLPGLPDDHLVGMLHRFERLRNRLSLVDHALVADVVERELPDG